MHAPEWPLAGARPGRLALVLSTRSCPPESDPHLFHPDAQTLTPSPFPPTPPLSFCSSSFKMTATTTTLRRLAFSHAIRSRCAYHPWYTVGGASAAQQ